MVGNNPYDSSVLQTYNILIYFGGKEKVYSAGTKVTENNFKSSDYGFKSHKCQNKFQFCNTSKQSFCRNSRKHVLCIDFDVRKKVLA